MMLHQRVTNEEILERWVQEANLPGSLRNE
jgi:hypothetical protein